MSSISNSTIQFEPINYSHDHSFEDYSSEVDTVESIKNIADNALDDIKYIWDFIKKVVGIIKYSLKITVIKCSHLAEKLNPIIARIGLLSFISLFYTLKSFPKKFEELLKQIDLEDIEGTFFAIGDLLTNAASTLYTVGHIVKDLHVLAVIPTVAFFSLISLPLIISMLAYSSIKGVYDIIRQSMFLHDTPDEITDENIDQWKKYLNDSLDLTTEEEKLNAEMKDRLLKRKINKLERHSDNRVVNIMKNLQTQLNQEKINKEEFNKGVRDIKTLMARKITVGAIDTVSNTALLVGIVVAEFFVPVSAFVIPSMILGKTAVSLGTHLYEEFGMEKKLENPKWIAAQTA